jgi:hypothetical protein
MHQRSKSAHRVWAGVEETKDVAVFRFDNVDGAKTEG